MKFTPPRTGCDLRVRRHEQREDGHVPATLLSPIFSTYQGISWSQASTHVSINITTRTDSQKDFSSPFFLFGLRITSCLQRDLSVSPLFIYIFFYLRTGSFSSLLFSNLFASMFVGQPTSVYHLHQFIFISELEQVWITRRRGGIKPVSLY